MVRLNHTTLCQAIVSEIKARILRGEWSSGTRLPTEQELCKEFGVSRSPLREALKALEAMGLITIRHGGGIFVNELPEPFARKRAFLTLDDGVTALHVLDLRRVLEVEAVRQVAKRSSHEDMRRLEELLENMKGNQDNIDLFREADLEFHLVLAELSGNPLLARILRELRPTLLKQMQRDTLVRESIADHTKILEAVLQGNAERAQQALERHFRRMYEFYLSEGEEHNPQSSGR